MVSCYVGAGSKSWVLLATEPSLLMMTSVISVHYTYFEVFLLWFPEFEKNSLCSLTQTKTTTANNLHWELIIR